MCFTLFKNLEHTSFNAVVAIANPLLNPMAIGGACFVPFEFLAFLALAKTVGHGNHTLPK